MLCKIFYKNLAVKPTCKIKNEYILCTIHRAENTDDENRLKNIFEALDEIAKEKQVILPLHPRTKKIIENLKLDIQNLTIIDPVGYLEMVWLIDNCELVMTEAFFFEKPCITLRDETEWVECGVNTLVGANKEKILEAYRSNSKFNIQNSTLNLYGAGKASEKNCWSFNLNILLITYYFPPCGAIGSKRWGEFHEEIIIYLFLYLPQIGKQENENIHYLGDELQYTPSTSINKEYSALDILLLLFEV